MQPQHQYSKNKRFHNPASSPKQSPCNIHATITMCFADHVANLYLSTHIKTLDNNNHAAIPMRITTTNPKTPYNCAHTSTPKTT